MDSTGKHCADCRWWDRRQAFHARAAVMAGWGICERSEIGTLDHFTSWDDDVAAASEDWDGDVFSPPEGMKMFAQDGSNYWAALITAPDFGCTEFEAAALDAPQQQERT